MSEIVVPAGSSATFVTLNSGDVMKVFGNATGTTINVGAQQIVEQGGTIDSSTAHGGTIAIGDGGRASFTNLYDGAVQHILAGGTAYGTYLTNSTQFLAAGASDNYVNVYQGGVDHISGSSHSITIATGGLVDLTQDGYSSGATLVDPAHAPTSYVGDISIQGGELRIEAGVPQAITLHDGRITLPFLHYDASTTSSYDSSGGGGLTISGNGGSYTLALFGPPPGTDFVVGGNAAGETIVTLSPLCFCAGTWLATPTGWRRVETLAPGDLVLNARGLARRVRWVGSGSDVATARRRPILVRRDAIEDGVPFADLRVTPGHRLLLDGVLVPVLALANGRSILPDAGIGRFRYHHVELDDHDVLLANGVLAESYHDDGNRRAFDAAAGDAADELPPYAPIVTEGPIVDAIWARFSARTPNPVLLDDDPVLRLRIGDAAVDPVSRDGNRFVFVLPEGVETMRLCSRSTIPADIGLCREHRRLGVAVRACETDWPGHRRLHPFDDAIFVDGVHEPEPASGFRWTDGDACLRWAEPLPAGARVTIEVGCLTRYAG